MKVAAAQISCKVGEVEDNLIAHLELIELAISHKVDLIAFPEMSITGYCRERGNELAFNRKDGRLQVLQELSSKGNIVIVAGAPIRLEGQLYIGSFILSPDRNIQIYTKQYLHDGEELFYSSSKSYNPSIVIGKEIMKLAICADISMEAHPQSAKECGATFYLPGIFYSVDGIASGNQVLGQYSEEYQLNILMSNYCGKHWGIQAGGMSGFWNTEGLKLAELDRNSSGLVIAKEIEGGWQATTVA